MLTSSAKGLDSSTSKNNKPIKYNSKIIFQLESKIELKYENTKAQKHKIHTEARKELDQRSSRSEQQEERSIKATRE